MCNAETREGERKGGYRVEGGETKGEKSRRRERGRDGEAGERRWKTSREKGIELKMEEKKIDINE